MPVSGDDSNCILMMTTTMMTTPQPLKDFLLGVFHTLGPIGAAVVLVWVGLWGLLDHYLFPHDAALSALTCLFFSIGLAVALHATVVSSSPSSSSLATSENTSSSSPTTTAPIHNSLSFVFLTASLGVCYWRGIWKLWESLVFVNNPLAQSLSAMLIGVSILLATGHFQHSIVGPSILFPPSQDQSISDTTETADTTTTTTTVSVPPSKSSSFDELRMPLHNDEEYHMDSMIMMTNLKGTSTS